MLLFRNPRWQRYVRAEHDRSSAEGSRASVGERWIAIGRSLAMEWTLFVPQRVSRIDSGCLAGRQVSRDEGCHIGDDNNGHDLHPWNDQL
jgi:hypothetical protein